MAAAGQSGGGALAVVGGSPVWARQGPLPAQKAPFVLQTALDDLSVSCEINATTDRPHLMASIYSDLHQNIQDTFNEAGVEIMSPHYSSLRDGNQSTVPESYLPQTYQAPGFRVRQADAPPRKPTSKPGAD
jgi:small-conductance mechanosensitive channel